MQVCWNCGTSHNGERDPTFALSGDERFGQDAKLAPFESPTSAAAPPTTTAPTVVHTAIAKSAVGAALIATLGFALIWWIELPRSAADFYNVGLDELVGRDYPRAIASFTAALDRAKHEDNVDRKYLRELISHIHAYRAVAYLNNRNLEAAIDDLSKSLQFVDLQESNYSEGKEIQSPILNRDTDASSGRFGYVINYEELVVYRRLLRANAHLLAERPEPAIADTIEVLRHFPEHTTARHILTAAEEGRDLNWNVQVTRTLCN